MPLDPVTWCDPRNYDARGQRLEGPCLYGLAWWIWLLLILGFCCCLLPVIWKVRASHKVGITPGRVVSFWEAVMLANHAYPNKSRLKGRPMSGTSPLDDLIQAQDCCCCLPLHKGLVLLSLVDLGRLGVQLALAIDSIAIYQQTEGPDAVPNADPRLAGLMDPELRRVMVELCIAVLVVAGTKVVLWLSVWTTTLTVDLINPLRALMVWAWVELLNTACFTTGTSMLNRDLCLVDIAIYNATGWHDGGFVGFRRGYLQGLPEDRFAPLHMHENTDVGPVIAVCEAFWVQEVLIEITDTVLCAVLVVYTVYIGYSHTQRVINGDGMLSRGLPSKGGRPGVRV